MKMYVITGGVIFALVIGMLYLNNLIITQVNKVVEDKGTVIHKNVNSAEKIDKVKTVDNLKPISGMLVYVSPPLEHKNPQKIIVNEAPVNKIPSEPKIIYEIPLDDGVLLQ